MEQRGIAQAVRRRRQHPPSAFGAPPKCPSACEVSSRYRGIDAKGGDNDINSRQLERTSVWEGEPNVV